MKAQSSAVAIALVALAVGGSAYAFFVDRTAVSDADRAERRTDAFPSFRVEDVRRIELTHGAEVLVLVRKGAVEREHEGASKREAEGSDGEAWTMTSPRTEPADAAAVDTLLRELELATRLRAVDEHEAVGLDAPRVRGRAFVGPVEYRFALGGDAPRPLGAAYMHIDGEGTFVVGRSVKVQLLRGADAYRNRALVPYGLADAGRLDVRTPAGEYALDRAETTFRVDGAGHHLRASRAAVDHIFAALADARAETFLPDADAERATADPTMTVTLTARDAGPGSPRGDGGARPRVVLLVGKACPDAPDDVVVRRIEPSPISACMAKGVAEALETTTDSLVDRSLFYAHADEIEEVRLDAPGPGRRIDIARDGTAWHERAPQEHELDSSETDSANALTLALADAQAVDVRKVDAPRPIAPVRARATIVRTGSGASEAVEIFASSEGGAFLAKRVDDGAILRLPLAVERRLEPHPVALRSLEIWASAFDPADVVGIDDSCGAVQRLRFQSGVWTMLQPAGIPADASTIADLASTMVHARAEAWIAEVDDDAFGLQGPGACTITLTLAGSGADGGPARVGVVFGAAGDGGVYARTLDDPAVFVAPSILREIASRPAIDRSRFDLNPSQLTDVTLARGSARVSLARDGDQLFVAGQHDDDAGESSRLGAALAAIHAPSAVHAGHPAAGEGFDRPTLEIDATERADAGTSPGLVHHAHIVIGAPGHAGGIDGYFARVSGIDATFVVPRREVSAILDAW